tara:strand:+ start:412 stop:846 length:435 start_codon:yes stop_codon:yes gene_type:complete
MNTPTLRTDARWERLRRSSQSWYQIAEEMKLDCRQNERELTAAQEEIKELNDKLDDAIAEATNAVNDIIRMKWQRYRLAEIYPLLTAAWFYNEWQAETLNEKKIQEIMEREKWWPWESEDKLLDALQSLNQSQPISKEKPDEYK